MAIDTSLHFSRMFIGVRTLLLATAVVASAFKSNYQDCLWVSSFVTAIGMTLCGIGVLYGERFFAKGNLLRRLCGEGLFILGLVVLLLLMLFPLWFRSTNAA